MTQKLILLACCIILILSGMAFAAEKTIGPNKPGDRRTALVIGNGAYTYVQPLTNPPNDAAGVARTLRELGFDVTERTNLNADQMNEEIVAFGRRLIRRGGVGLFYFSGHGVQYNGINYLIPVRADIQHEKQLRFRAVAADIVLAEMENARNGMNIVILDACRNNPFAGRFKSYGRNGLASVDAPGGTVIAYATSPGKTASEGPGKYSLYTHELIRQMKVPGQRLADMFNGIRRKLKSRTKGKQTPWESTSLEWPFYFDPSGMVADGSAVIVRPAPEAAKGGLRVKTTPSGAAVWVDGSHVGSSPVTLRGLNPGQVRIRASLKGYRDREDRVSVEKGVITQLNLYLDRAVTSTTTRPTTTTVRPRDPSVTQGRVRLRKQPRTLSDDDVKKMLARYNFSDSDWNKSGDFENDFVKSRDGKTVTDRVTGLMWQQSGSDNYMVYKKAQPYIDRLNRNRFAGYNDWRLPTLEELMSLMERKKVNDVYIDPVFDSNQWWCWSADKGSSGRAWYAYFIIGLASRYSLGDSYYVRGVRP